MRQARAGDVWVKAISRRPGNVELKKLTTTNVRGIGDAVINFSSPLTAICGENGAGKTTLLKTLYAALVSEQANSEGIRLRPGHGVEAPDASVTIGYLDGEPASRRRDIESKSDLAGIRFGEDGRPQVIYLDAARAAQRIRYVVEHDHDFSTALEGTPQAPDNVELLQLRREITGRGYDSVISYEIEEYSDEPVFPYFKVESGRSKYGSEDMGLGELCVNHMIWAFERAAENSIILLEEPESHLPPRAQIRLMNYVASRSLEKKLTIVVSTHSSHTMARLPRANITLVARNGDRFIHTAAPQRSVLYESLRVTPSKAALIIAEDHSAAALITGMIRASDEALLERLEICWVNGYGDIDEILKRKPKGLTNISVVGVYDGDQKATKGEDGINVFLPGSNDPAHDLSEIVKAAPQDFSSLFSEDLIAAVDTALAHCAQIDGKDYFLEIARSLGDSVDINTIYKFASILWLRVPANATSGEEFAKKLKERLRL